MCISWNSWWRCSIARTSKICLDWHQKSDFELNSNIHLRHSCNQNMQNIVTWGQNMSANIEEFACISMGGLFSGVPPQECGLQISGTSKLFYIMYILFPLLTVCARLLAANKQAGVRDCGTSHFDEYRGVTGIFFWGDKVLFPDFFPR